MEVQHEGKEERELDGEVDQAGNDNGERHHQAGEVHLAEDARVVHESVGGPGEAVGEVVPQHRAGKVEQHLRQPVGGQLRDLPEDDREHQRGQDGLDDQPQRTEDGLLEARNEVAAYEQRHQVAVLPDLAELQVIPLLARGDDQIPLVGVGLQGLSIHCVALLISV